MKVLIATDGSDFSRDAIAEALKYLEPRQTRFRVISCWEEPGEIAATQYDLAIEYYKHADAAARLAAESAADRAEAQIRRFYLPESVKVDKKISSGSPDQLIVDEVGSWKPDIVVVGTHGRGFWGRLLGSVSTGVIHHAPCTVFVGRKKQKSP